MANQPYNPRSLSVLVVDDHDPIRKAIIRIISSMGFTDIAECFDGSDAIETLKKKPLDLVICDLYMRKVKGFEVIRYIRNRNMGNDVPIIVVTGEASRDEIVKVADYGADDYVLKPFQVDDLEKKITSVLTKYYSPPPLLATLRTAERHFLNGDHDVALKAFDEALRIDGASMRAIYGKATTLSTLGNDLEALELLNETVKSNQSYYKNFSAIADINLKTGQTKPAIKAMRAELEINPKQPKRQIQLAKMLLKEFDSMGAISHYREALKESPNVKAALMGMGMAFARAENIDKAFYYFKRTRRYHPTATKALESAVKLGLAAGEDKKVELFLKDERNNHPDRKDTYIILAKFYARTSRYEEAIEVLDALLGKEPENMQALKMKGALLLRMKKFRDAIKIFNETLSVAPDMETYIHLAEAHIGIGEVVVAMDTLHKSMALNNSYGPTFYALGEIYLAQNEFLKAYISFHKAAVNGGDRALCREDAKIAKAQIVARRNPRRAS